MNDTKQNRKRHPLYFLLKSYPFLGEIRHDFSDFNLYLEALNKHFNQSLYRQLVANLKFSPDILKKYESSYLKSIPVAADGGSIFNKFIFQISNHLLMDVGFGIDTKTENLVIYAQFHSTCLNHVVDFIDSNQEFIIEDEEEKSLGFGGM